MSDELNADAIRERLHQVAAELGADGPSHTVLLVGGALLALHDLRESTHDLDSVLKLDPELQEAVRAVARKHGLAHKWLNDSAAPFAPATLSESDCLSVFEEGRLRVLGAPLKELFVMKLNSGRAADVIDMIRLWPHTGFDSAPAAVEHFTEAYPTEREDEFLVAFVQQIAETSSSQDS